MSIRPYQDPPHLASRLSFKSLWLSALTFVIGALISLLLWYALVLQSYNNVSSIITLESEHLTKDIQNQLELRISALKHMSKHLEMIQIINYQDWQQTASDYLNNYAGFQAIAWTDNNFKTQWTAPSNDAATSTLFNGFTAQYKGEIEAINTPNTLWLSPLYSLNTRHEKGYFIVIPYISAVGHHTGYLISLINVKDLFNIQVDTNDFVISIYDGNQLIYQYGSALQLDAAARTITRQMNPIGAMWTVYIQPSQQFINSLTTSLPWITLILGLMISLLFAITVRLIQTGKDRTLTLFRTNEDLKNEIRDRKLAEETKQKLEKALLQGQKLQAIGTLAAGIAHDFNNILYAIKGYTEIAREDTSQDQLTFNNLGKVMQAAQRGQELVARILSFSRRQHHEVHPIYLRDVIEGAMGLLTPAIPASVTITFTNSLPENYTLLGNTTQLHQVFVNIINNAVDSMDGEGEIHIDITSVQANDKLLEQFPNMTRGNYCKIEISDTGHGMDETMLERIFEPFFTTKEVGKGTGLGLATVHAIIEEHLGEIKVTSQLGHGTTFTILLPEYTYQLEGNKENSDGEYTAR